MNVKEKEQREGEGEGEGEGSLVLFNAESKAEELAGEDPLQ